MYDYIPACTMLQALNPLMPYTRIAAAIGVDRSKIYNVLQRNAELKAPDYIKLRSLYDNMLPLISRKTAVQDTCSRAEE